MRTAQEVANDLNLTRTEVYNLLRKKRFSSLVQKKGGQVSINNDLFELLKKEVEEKKLNRKSNLANTEVVNNSSKIKVEDFNNIELLKNQIKLKDNQIAILNIIITNNLSRIKELEEKNYEFKELTEELSNLKLIINTMQNKKKKKWFLGIF